LDHARSAASTALAAAGGSPLCASMRSAGRFKSSAGRAAFPRRALRLSFGERGRSSVVERQLPKLYVEGSIPFARSNPRHQVGGGCNRVRLAECMRGQITFREKNGPD
jgi:hypothetical protein